MASVIVGVFLWSEVPDFEERSVHRACEKQVGGNPFSGENPFFRSVVWGVDFAIAVTCLVSLLPAGIDRRGGGAVLRRG